MRSLWSIALLTTYACIDDPTLTVVVVGNGRVTSEPAGIDCGTACSMTVSRTALLIARPAVAGDGAVWSGGGCETATDSCWPGLRGDTQVTVTFTPLVACQGGLYDPCTQPEDCASGICRTYPAAGFSVCTQTCTSDTACPPDSVGAPGFCNFAGLCAPSQPNACP